MLFRSRVMEILANATNVIAEGEVLQLMNMRDPDVTEARYFEVIHSKTAKLFEAAATLGSLIANAPASAIQAASAYGRSLGTAFQLIDDLLDYSGNAEDIGKNLGDDLREGKITLPLIRLMQIGTGEQRDLVRACIESGDGSRFGDILTALTSSGALEYTKDLAEQAALSASSAIAALPNSQTKNSLLKLSAFAAGRNH